MYVKPNDILARLDSERIKAEETAKRKNKLFLDDHPELSELLRRKKKAELDITGVSISDEAEAEKRRERLNAVTELIKEKYGKWESEPEYKCRLCGDTGFTDKAKGKPCRCFIDALYVRGYGGTDIARLGGSFEEFDEAVIPEDDGQRQNVLGIKVMAEKACQADGIRFFTLIGGEGSGKSFILESMAKKVASAGRAAAYFDASVLFGLLAKERLSEEKPFLSYLYNCDAIFIDNLNPELFNSTIAADCFFRFVQKRDFPFLFTVFATSLDIYDLKKRCGERVTSRIFAEDCSKVYKFKEGKDLGEIFGKKKIKRVFK